MADYIDKNILCQAYLHFEPSELPLSKQTHYLDYLKKCSSDRARFFLYPEVETDIESKQGTLTAYVTIAGSIATVIDGYPTFRKGVIAIYENVKRLAESINFEGLFFAKARRGDVIRIEARTGVIGSLRNIVSIVDAIHEHNGIRSEKWILSKIDTLSEDIDRLLKNVNSATDREFGCSGLLTVINKLPPKPQALRGRLADPQITKLYQGYLSEIRTTLESGRKRNRNGQ